MGVRRVCTPANIGELAHHGRHRPKKACNVLLYSYKGRKHFNGKVPPMNFIREYLAFLKESKKLWILPVVLIMLALGGLLIFAESSALAPLIYSFF
jgi:hypothetical protein